VEASKAEVGMTPIDEVARATSPRISHPLLIGDHAMLFLTEKLLKAAGIEYDVILDTWIAPVPLLPVVTVECEEHGAYIMEALVEVHAILHANGVTYNNFAISGGYLSLVGLSTMELAAVA
jgi:hypothetical protein